jgi:HAE1 family hydrophobic/amphiphilic exporter-1
MIFIGAIALMLFGAMAYFTMPVSLMPDMKIPTITVRIIYPGASPQVIENTVTKKIENQLSTIGGLDSILSYSRENVSAIVANFTMGKDENLAVQEIKEKVSAIAADLPADAQEPVIAKVDISSISPVVSIVVDGDMSSAELFTFTSGTIYEKLSQVTGVGSITISGGSQREIHINLDRSTIYDHRIVIPQLAGLLAAANQEIPGGIFSFENRDLPVQFRGEFTSLEEIRDMDIPAGTGIYKLRQIAAVEDTVKTARERAILLDKKRGNRNENAVLLQVIKNPSANTVQLVDDIIAAIPGIEALSGSRVRLTVIQEDATYVRDTVRDTLSNVMLGILLTGLVLLFFLHDLRSTIIVALAMPFAIISTFLVMKALGITVNLYSLMGLSGATGTLVANSVVVLENIFRYRVMGHKRIESASKGTREVIAAVFASTMTNIVVFVPLGSITGIIGPVIFNFAFTVVISTGFSILVSFTLTPLMAARILPEVSAGRTKGNVFGRGLERVFKSWEKGYRRILEFILKRKRRSALTLSVTFVLFVLCLTLVPYIKIVSMPGGDGGKIQINVRLSQGSDLESTAALLKIIEDRLALYDEVETVTTIMGSIMGSDSSVIQNTNLAYMKVNLSSRKNRTISNTAFAERLFSALSDLPGADIQISAIPELGNISSGGIDLYLKGTDTFLLQEKAEEMKKIMNETPGIANTVLSSNQGKLELVFTPNRKQISADGLTVQFVAINLRAAIDGLIATTYKEGGEEYEIRLSVSGGSLRDIEDIRNIPIVTPSGAYPLSRYADTEFMNGTDQIMRSDKTQTVRITADLLAGYSSANVMTQVFKGFEAMGLPDDYSLEPAGNTKLMDDATRDIAIAFLISVVLTYMLLAVILESLVEPLFILVTVPLSFIGIILITIITGTILNTIALIGIIMLVGIVVNNAILILDYYGQLRKKGAGVKEALLEACPVKLKPVLMSNIAIVLGMLPMALGIGDSGAEIRQPMGIVIVGGIISSMVLTLLLIPSLEYLASKTTKEAARG